MAEAAVESPFEGPKADTEKTWWHLHSFIQTEYQCHLQTGATTAAQGGYINWFAVLFVEDEVFNDNTTKTIVGTINTCMTNLSVQTNTSIKANATQINALLQHLAANNNQLNLQQHAILQHMAVLSTNPPPATMARTYIPPAPGIFSPPPPFKGANSSTSRWSCNCTSGITNIAGEVEVVAVEVGACAMPGEEEDGANQHLHCTLVGIR
jgi:hypothetical protein